VDGDQYSGSLISMRYDIFLQVTPLKDIRQGRGPCDPSATGESSAACGGTKRGHCTSDHTCDCLERWTGPNCLAYNGWDPITYDAPDRIVDVGFAPPVVVASWFLISALGILGGCLLLMVRWKRAMDGWEPVPDVTKA
jgi:hypothetical protein